MSRWKFHWGGVSVDDPLGCGKFLIARQNDRILHVAEPLTMVPVTEGSVIPLRPTIRFSDDKEQFQQALMDSLWAEGVRPSDHKLTSRAQERHLDDMRKIVGKQLGVDL